METKNIIFELRTKRGMSQDELAEKIKEANEIIAFCESKLTKADQEIEKILAEKQESEE